MKELIFKNREVLAGLTFDAKLNGELIKFKILYVNDKVIKITTSIKFEDLIFVDSDSFAGTVRKLIEETCPNNKLSLSRQASISKMKLKQIPIIIEGNKFQIDYITPSQIIIGKSIEYDSLLNSKEGSFENNVKHIVEKNLLSDPPKPKKIKTHGLYWGHVPYLFDSAGDGMHFVELGPRRTVISEKKLEENREKYKEQHKKEKKAREHMEKLEKELNLDKKHATRDLARFR